MLAPPSSLLFFSTSSHSTLQYFDPIIRSPLCLDIFALVRRFNRHSRSNSLIHQMNCNTMSSCHTPDELELFSDQDNDDSQPKITPQSNQNCNLALNPLMASDESLNYIRQILLEEEIDEKLSLYQEEAALEAMEKPFYDILELKYPPSSNTPSISYLSQDSSCFTSKGHVLDRGVEKEMNFLSSVDQLTIDSQASKLSFSQAHLNDGHFIVVGVEGGRILEKEEERGYTIHGLHADNLSFPHNKEDINLVKINPVGEERLEKEEDRAYMIDRSKGKRNLDGQELDFIGGRNYKQSAIYSDEPVRDEIFDKVLLGGGLEEDVASLQDKMQTRSKEPSKKVNQKDLVDLRTLLVDCSHAIGSNDFSTAQKLIKRIREHSSPDGDGSQRLACCFVDGLVARLAGRGTGIYKQFVSKRIGVKDFLKAFHLTHMSCPFASYWFAKVTIVDMVKKKPKLHVIDLGIGFGFQWPSLIKDLSDRVGGPPKLRITGIDTPMPGFRPNEQIEETGRRLADYARSFKVPFEYEYIASQLEAFTIEDLKIDKDEVLVVNCMLCLENLGDEAIDMDSPRNRVLRNIREMKPHIFIQGINNASYSDSFFVPRFKQLLFYYSALFDMLDSTIPRENKERQLVERVLYGPKIINVIACEGSERLDRPESYRQWTKRNSQAGFEQLPVDLRTLKDMKDKVKELHHKDFFIGEDSKWLIHGWKGRILFAVSTWKVKET